MADSQTNLNNIPPFSPRTYRRFGRLILKNSANIPIKAKIIACEGGKGTGKNELIQGLSEYGLSEGYNVYYLKESDKDINATKRRELQNSSSLSKAALEHQILYLNSAGRIHMIGNSPVKDWLIDEKGLILIDRYIATTIAKQLAGGNYDVRHIVEIMKGSYVNPNIVFRTQCPPNTALKRQIDRAREKGRGIESGSLSLDEIVLMEKAYDVFFKMVPDKYNSKTLNTYFPDLSESDSIKKVNEDVIKYFKEKIKK